MHHLYLSIQPSSAACDAERRALETWCEERGIGEYNIIEESLGASKLSAKRIGALLAPVAPGDVVVVTRLSRLGRGLAMFGAILDAILSRGATILTLDNGQSIGADLQSRVLTESIRTACQLEEQIRSERSHEALRYAGEHGRRPGRPKGVMNSAQSNVLHGKDDAIRQMRAAGLSVNRIAMRLGVSPATIAKFINDNGLPHLR